MKDLKIHIGTSGWSYQHWKENFYPEKFPSKDWLHFYANHFNTVEVNTTFYHTPLVTTTKKWKEQVPNDFQFSIKANRYITHQKKLNDCKDSLKIFYKSLQKLKEKVGPILFQLPPSFQINFSRLEEFISLLSSNYRYTFEFRHKTWFIDEVYDLLAKHNIALCITDLNKKLSPKKITAEFTYIRLHGPAKAYQGTYGPARLRIWKKRIEAWRSEGIEIFCYFDNDEKGYAIEDALFLSNLFINK